MARFIQVPLRPEESDALVRLSQEQLRTAKQQAQLLLREGLRSSGVLGSPADPAERNERESRVQANRQRIAGRINTENAGWRR
jgi:hypothetical protein